MGIVDIAMNEVGTMENGQNNIKYNDWYYGSHKAGSAYPYCAVFICWCAYQAGIPTTVIPKTASTSNMLSFFKGEKRFQPKGNGYKPQPGDIMINKSNGASHVGLVIKCEGNTFYTVEGNAGANTDGVYQCSHSLTNPKLTGFGVPAYNGNPADGNYDLKDTGGGGGTTTPESPSGYTATSGSGGISNEGQDINLNHTVSVKVYKPTIEVEFHTETGVLAAVSGSGKIKNKDDVDSDIISLNTVRNMNDDAPTFSINLVWRNDWYHQMSSNDVVIIKMQRPPETKRTVFIGLIDDIRRSADFSQIGPKRVMQVTGRGLNKALINYEMGVVNGFGEFGFQNMGMMNGLFNCSPDVAVSTVLGWYVGSGFQYKFSDNTTFESRYSTSIHKDTKKDVSLMSSVESYLTYCGSMWNFIKEISNTPFNEMFWECEGNKAVFNFRPTPFNKSDWNNLNRITIKDDDIVSDGLGRSDLETYTLYKTSSTNTDSNTNMYFPLFYEPMLDKYGIKMLEVQTPYTILGSDTELQFNTDLYNWNIKNNVFHNGNLVVKGKAAYKIGERVILEDDGMEYYVESVTHSFTIFGSWTTTLGLTRGIKPSQRFSDPWGCWKTFDTAMMSKLLALQTGGAEGGSGSYNWSSYNGSDTGKYSDAYTQGSKVNPADFTSAGTVNTSPNARYIFDYLVGHGFNQAAACGVLANIDAESGFDQTAKGDSGTSYGLCQWHNGRMTGVQDYCKTHYNDISSIDGQLEYLFYELDTSESTAGSKIRNVPDTIDGAFEAGYNWCYYFERPSNKASKSESRGRNAKKYYEEYVG